MLPLEAVFQSLQDCFNLFSCLGEAGEERKSREKVMMSLGPAVGVVGCHASRGAERAG